MTKKDLKRFWAKVRVDPATGCWVWTAAVVKWRREPWDGGYGAFKLDGRVERAHKVAYRILFGRWPERGKVLLHGCDNRRCVNVLEHIQPGTQAQNVADMLAKGRSIHQRRNGTIGGINAKAAEEALAPDRPVSVDLADFGAGRGDHLRGPGSPGPA